MSARLLVVVFLFLAGCIGPTAVPVEVPGWGGEPILGQGVVELRIVSNTSYHDRSGYFKVIGEAANDADRPMAFAFAHVRYYDGDGAFIEELIRPAFRTVIPSGERTPFEVTLVGGRAVASYLVDVTAEEADGMVASPTTRVVASELTSEPGGVWWLRGEVTNDALTVAREPQVAGTVYDEAGRVIGVATAFTAPTDVAPRGKAAFTMIFDELRGTPARHDATT